MDEVQVHGGRSPQARTVVVYGNCQAPYLARMLATIDDLNDDYRFVVADSYVMPGRSQAIAVPGELLQEAVLVLRQHEDRVDNPAWVALRARVPDCPVVSFPSFLLASAWPFECPEPRGEPEPGYFWKRYPLGDLIGLQVARSGLTGALAVAAYMDLSHRKMPDLRVRLERDLERMHLHDSRCEVRLGDFVERRFRDEQLFWTNGHVSEAAVTELARRVADAARHVLGGTSRRAEECLACAGGFEGMGALQAPIHPVVAEALRLRFWHHDLTYRWYSQRWTFYEYMERYIAYDVNW